LSNNREEVSLSRLFIDPSPFIPLPFKWEREEVLEMGRISSLTLLPFLTEANPLLKILYLSFSGVSKRGEVPLFLYSPFPYQGKGARGIGW
jgi:hypothetical protein